jgi:uncharacterized membrane protein
MLGPRLAFDPRPSETLPVEIAVLARLVRLVAPSTALLASLAAWPFMPDPMPIHWGLDGRPDGFAPRVVGLFLLPLVAFVVPGLIASLSKRDRGLGVRARGALELTLAAIATFLSAVHGLALVASAGDGGLPVAWLTAMLGGLFVVLGSAMKDIEPNGWIGVRTAATLRDPAIWTAVHDKTSIAFVLAGALSILGALVLPAPAALALAIASTLVVGLGSVAFAWSLGRARG